MAFQDVNNLAPRASKDPVKLSQIDVGSSVTGYVVRFVPSKHNPENMNILLQAEDSSDTFYVYTSGNMKYLIGDGKIREGLLTKITRLADKNVKGKTSTQFQVLQDPEQTLEDASFNALGIGAEAPQAAPSATASSPAAVRAAVEKNIRAQATKLTQAMKRS